MLNTATANNIRNISTGITRRPKLVYDPAERRARLQAQIKTLCQRHSITDPDDVNAWVRLAMRYLENNLSHASAYDETRKSIERTTRQFSELQL